VTQQRELVIFVRPKLVEQFADATHDPLNTEPVVPRNFLFTPQSSKNQDKP
jgi:hypothetical protein